jgi:hypothetical protein
MRRFILATIASLALAAFAAVPAGAAPNPNHGQPNQSCGTDGATSMPNGFNSGGFANAEGVYAHAQNGNQKAVSQYDVACYQQTQNGH